MFQVCNYANTQLCKYAPNKQMYNQTTEQTEVQFINENKHPNKQINNLAIKQSHVQYKQ